MNEINNDEISFDVRKDQAITFYKKNKKKISNIAFLIILAIAGYFFFKTRQNEARTDAARSLYSAMMNTNTQQALKNLETIAKKSGYTYSDLVKFYGAALYEKNGDLNDAKEVLQRVVDETSHPAFKAVAELRLAQLNIDLGSDLEKTESILKGYTENAASPWQMQAMELLGALQLKKGSKEKATLSFNQIVRSDKAPADMAMRTKFILATL